MKLSDGIDKLSTTLIGHSQAMTQIRQWVAKVAGHAAPVLLLGETGTGKDVVACALARYGLRQGQPYVPLNCAALNTQLVESELFGHERGAFTGAHSRKMGAFEAANGGTLFLDEVGELSPSLQAHLLRVLETGEVRRVGNIHAQRVQVRIVAATNRCLQTEIARGRFRLDLYHRLHVLALRLPALRERREDLAALVQHFLRTDEVTQGPVHIRDAAVHKLMQHSWPGNIRELRNVLQRASLFCDNRMIEAHNLTFGDTRLAPVAAPSTSGDTTLQQLERGAIVAALAQCAGNRTHAALHLGLSRATLHRRLHTLGLHRPHAPVPL